MRRSRSSISTTACSSARLDAADDDHGAERRVVRRLAAGLALAVGLIVAASSPATTRTLPRSTSDRPDDVAGSQVHAVYAVPSDGADRALDTDGTIEASVTNFQNWLRGQTGGRGLRLDTYQSQLDVTFFRLSESDAQLAARGLYLRDEVERQLQASGLIRPGKIYALYYDGSNTAACGGAAWPPVLPGSIAGVYMRATYGQGSPCYDATRSRAGLHLMDLAVLHELLHVLGFVPTCAPHHTRAGHVSDNPNDLMWAGDGSWTPSVLDSGRDDYYGANVSGCPDLSTSLFLEGNEPPPPPPPPPPRPPPPPPPASVRPRVVTGGATGVTFVAATIRGSVDAGGSSAAVRVEYGPTRRYGAASGATTIRASGAVRVAIRLSGLSRGKTYHYRLRAANGAGSSVGRDRIFRTKGGRRS